MRFFTVPGLRLAATLSVLVQPAVAQHRPITVDDVLTIERLDLATVSPDGALVAAVVLRGAGPGEVYGRTAHEVDPSRADIWLLDRETGKRRNLTQGQVSASGAWCAAWSPDGEHLAFLSTRSDGAEPRGGDNVRLYSWERRSGKFRRLSGRGIVTQSRYGGGMHKLDMAGPGASKPGICNAGEENAPFVWLDRHRLLVLMLPTGQVSGLIDDQASAYRDARETQLALSAGRDARVSVSGSGAERTRAGPEWTAHLSLGPVGIHNVVRM